MKEVFQPNILAKTDPPLQSLSISTVPLVDCNANLVTVHFGCQPGHRSQARSDVVEMWCLYVHFFSIPRAEITTLWCAGLLLHNILK